MHGIVSLLDDPHYQQVMEIWATLKQEIGVSGVYTTPFPHFSYYVAEHYDRERLKPIVTQLASQIAPFQVETTGLAIFTGGLSPVLYVNVVRSPQLSHIHQLLWPALNPFCSGIVTYYHPNHWVPHITLGHGDLTPENLPEAIRLLQRWSFTWKIAINNFSLLYTEENSHQDKLYFRANFTSTPTLSTFSQ